MSPRHTHDPHEIQTAEDLLAKMRAGTRQVHEIRMRDLVIPVRVLTIEEMNLIRRDAIKQAIAASGDEIDKNVLVQRSTLKLATTVEKGGAPFLSDKVLSLTTVDEINHLYNEYIRIVESVNPSLEQISSEQFKSLVDALKKSLITSNDLSLVQLRAICTAFVDLIQRQAAQVSHKDN